MGLRDAFHTRGGGGKIKKLLGILNLTWMGFEEKTFTKIEAHAGIVEQLVRDFAIEEALQTEIKRNTRSQKSVIFRLVYSIRQEKNKNKVKLTITYDMGCQKISYGRRYDSSSRNAFIIGDKSKGIIGMVLYSKACRKCDGSKKRGGVLEYYECPNKFEGSSKNIEASAIMNMVDYAFYNLFFIIDVIVREDDSTI